MITINTLYWIILSLTALIIGSFLNVVIHRLPQMMAAESCEQFNLCLPRSHCPSCKQTIPFWHNIPLLSFIVLKGRCALCSARISHQYLVVELSTLLFSLFAASHFGFGVSLCFSLLFMWFIICLFVIDLKHQLLPDSLTLGLLWIGLMANTLTLFTPLTNAVIGAVVGYLSLWLVIKTYYFFTGKVGMGHGDFKLLAALGAWFGWQTLPLLLLIASVSGALIGSIYLKANKQSRHTPIPFGPFLCLSGFVFLFWGDAIVRLAF